MKNIGLIDDKDKSRRAFMLKLKLKIEEQHPEWNILDSKPFKEIDDYRQWILENDISILIVDERLDEESLNDGTYVNYFGSDLVIELRNYFKDFPIYCITNVEITDKLRKALHYFNLILSRQKFDADIDNYLNSFIKTGISFYTEYKKELLRLSELSNIIANGGETPENLNELQSLQYKLVIPHITEDTKSREQYLEGLEKQINVIKSMQDELTKLLKSE